MDRAAANDGGRDRRDRAGFDSRARRRAGRPDPRQRRRSSRPTSTWRRPISAASDANRELLLANAAERARFELSLEAIKTFHGGVSEDLLLKEKQFDGLRTKLLRGATDFYQRLEDLLAGQADHRSRAALGQAYHDIGELTARIGSQAEALAALKRGLELRLALAAEPNADAATKLKAGQSLIAVGDLQEATGESPGPWRRTSRRATSWSPWPGSEPDDAAPARPWRNACTASPGSSTTPATRQRRSPRTSRRGPSARGWPTPTPTSLNSRPTSW